MIAELDHTFATGTGLAGSAVNRMFLWGPDLSGTMTEAGGVGGLLSTTYQCITYEACSDANGNVTGLVPVSGMDAGTLTARYDYDPFGNRVANSGPGVELCPFGFSSKYLEPECSIVSYELRGYLPRLGRWLNIDPIGQEGGINIYEMCVNDPVNNIDYLGQVIVRTKQSLAIDADGTPNAYHPDDIGLDYLENAGKPGKWFGVVTDKAGTKAYRRGKPLVQGPSDPYPGYYVSPTSLFDATKAHGDPTRYVDSRFVRYIVHYEADSLKGSMPGDFATVVDTKNGKAIHAIVADSKGSGSG